MIASKENMLKSLVRSRPYVNCAWHYVSLIDSLTLIWWNQVVVPLKKERDEFARSGVLVDAVAVAVVVAVVVVVKVVVVVLIVIVLYSQEMKYENVTTVPENISGNYKWSNQTDECWGDLLIPQKITSTFLNKQILEMA